MLIMFLNFTAKIQKKFHICKFYCNYFEKMLTFLHFSCKYEFFFVLLHPK